MLGAVGDLQFDVAVRRLQDEYHVETTLDMLSQNVLRIVAQGGQDVRWPSDAVRLVQRDGTEAALFRSERDVAYLEERYPEMRFRRISDAVE